MRVLFASSEVAPLAKTGGLADVAGTLPLALAKLGAQVMVVMPRYRGLPDGPVRLAPGVEVHLIENEAFFNRASYYGNEQGDYPDNLQRFSYFCNESLDLARRTGFKPDIVHAHDWQAALLPVLLKTRWSSEPFFSGARTLLTVHNLAYQGVFPKRMYPELGLDPSLYSMDGFEFYGKINFLKAGLFFADALSTVSPTYAQEMQTAEYGCGLDGVIRVRRESMRGILNGLDYSVWDPAKDLKIASKYGPERPAGKAACKKDLQKTCGLVEDPSAPVFGIVSRLAEQKGIDLLVAVCDRLLAGNAQLVVLGDGDSAYKRALSSVAKNHPGKASVHLGFHAAEAHRIYAGSDFFLMPSHFEPCGLGQLISLKYGTLPVVRATGGLADTIVDADLDPKRGNGFVFGERSPEAFLEAAHRATAAYADPKRMAALRRAAMSADFSWKRSAAEYMRFYKEIRKN